MNSDSDAIVIGAWAAGLFVHGKPAEIWDLLKSASLAACDVSAQHWCWRDGRLGRCEDAFGGVDELLGGCAAEPEDDLSFLFQSLDRNSLHLNSVAKAVEWSSGQARVDLESTGHEDLGSLTARKLIVTVPLGVLREMRFAPEPVEALQAAHDLELGQAARITFLFRDRFWEEDKQLSGMGFLHSLEPWFPTWWTRAPIRVPILTGWAGGPAARQASGCGAAVLADHALDTLARLLARGRAQLQSLMVASYFHDWWCDPFAGGAYTYVPKGAMKAPGRLSEPVKETLFFAGEASDVSGHFGTVHGAIASGRRAAKQVLASS